jgi:hypothetical protein
MALGRWKGRRQRPIERVQQVGPTRLFCGSMLPSHVLKQSIRAVSEAVHLHTAVYRDARQDRKQNFSKGRGTVPLQERFSVNLKAATLSTGGKMTNENSTTHDESRFAAIEARLGALEAHAAAAAEALVSSRRADVSRVARAGAGASGGKTWGAARARMSGRTGCNLWAATVCQRRW